MVLFRLQWALSLGDSCQCACRDRKTGEETEKKLETNTFRNTERSTHTVEKDDATQVSAAY